jgi:hypothetical protein
MMIIAMYIPIAALSLLAKAGSSGGQGTEQPSPKPHPGDPSKIHHSRSCAFAKTWQTMGID